MKYFLKKASYIKCLLFIIEKVCLRMEDDKFVRSENACDPNGKKSSILAHSFNSDSNVARSTNPGNIKIIFSQPNCNCKIINPAL